MKKIIYLILLLGFLLLLLKKEPKTLKPKRVAVALDTIRIDSVSISPDYFKLLNRLKQVIDTSNYKVNYAKALLILDSKKFDSITIEYQALPTFLTKKYSFFDEKIIAPKSTDLSRLYGLQGAVKKKNFQPFDGLTTSGSLSRGLTVGNNQNAVVNSNLDLQISGYLSKDVQLRASITDSNIPLQENGFTQRLDEFDRVFIELISKNWRINAGDVNFSNTKNRFLKFDKR